MSDLKNVIEQVINKVEKHRELYARSEQSVRDQLINPILKNLGWDTTEPDFVHANVTNDDGRIPDYTLLKGNEKKLVLEAKRLAINLDDAKVIRQLSDYCYPFGIEFGILTDGVVWQLFSTFERNPNDRIVWSIDISKCDDQELLKLEMLAYDKIESLENELKQLKVFKILDNYFNPIFNTKEAFLNWCELSLKNDFIDNNKQYKSKEENIQKYISQKLNGFLFQENLLQIIENQLVIQPLSIQKTIKSVSENNNIKSIKTEDKSEKQYRIYNINQPFDLAFTKILEGQIGEEIAKNWNGLLHVVIKQLILKGILIQDIMDLTSLNILQGNHFDNGFNAIQNTHYSLQNVAANKCGKAILILANKFNIFIDIKFMWREDDKAAFPNEYGKIINN